MQPVGAGCIDGGKLRPLARSIVDGVGPPRRPATADARLLQLTGSSQSSILLLPGANTAYKPRGCCQHKRVRSAKRTRRMAKRVVQQRKRIRGESVHHPVPRFHVLRTPTAVLNRDQTVVLLGCDTEALAFLKVARSLHQPNATARDRAPRQAKRNAKAGNRQYDTMDELDQR